MRSGWEGVWGDHNQEPTNLIDNFVDHTTLQVYTFQENHVEVLKQLYV